MMEHSMVKYGTMEDVVVACVQIGVWWKLRKEQEFCKAVAGAE